MAIKIKSYYKTVEIDNERLKESFIRCQNQDSKIYELFKTFGSLTKWDAYDIYGEIHQPILPSSVGRSISSLLNLGVITKGELVEGDMGAPNTLYKIVDGSPEQLNKQTIKRAPKSISIKIEFKMDDNNEPIIDIDKMQGSFYKSMVSLVEKYG